MVGCNLYVPSVYTGADHTGIESVFRIPAAGSKQIAAGPTVRMVDHCYLGTDPPDLDLDLDLVATVPDSEERRISWCNFLQQLGCKVTPELTAKSYMLNAQSALNLFGVTARGSVAVHDFVLSPEFRKVIAAGQQEPLGALLGLMDRHWVESYAQRQHCVLEYQQQNGGMKRVDKVPASFIRELRETMRVPTSHGLLSLSGVFSRTPELLRLFGEGSVPFLVPHLELSSAEMKQALGVSGELTAELALAVLRSERSRCAAALSAWVGTGTKARVTAAYEILRMRFDQEGAQIRRAFAAEALIAAPSSDAHVLGAAPGQAVRFLMPNQCCWEERDAAFGTQHGFLELHYAGLETFFCGQLGVLKHLSMRDTADRLVELSLSHRVPLPGQESAALAAVQGLALQLYQRLELWLSFAKTADGKAAAAAMSWPLAEPLDWQCLEQLRSMAIFLSQRGIFFHPSAVLAPDDIELQNLFGAASAGPVNLLAVSAAEATQLGHLLGFFGVGQLSVAVSAAPDFVVDERTAPRDDAWTKKCVATLLPLARYLQHRQPARFFALQHNGVFMRLTQNLHVCTIQPGGELRVRYTLPAAAAGAAPASSVAVRAAVEVRQLGQAAVNLLVVDVSSVRDNLDQLASELLKLLGDPSACGDVELVNFVELLLSKPSSGAIERMLQHRKTPDLTAGMMQALGLQRIVFTDPAPVPAAVRSDDLDVAAPAAAAAGEESSDDESEEEAGEVLVVRPVAAAHRETSVARQVHQGKTAELRCAKEEAARLWKWLCKGQSEPWSSLSAEFRRINQLGARGGGADLIDVRRPGSEDALAARLHVAAVAEGIGYDVLSVEETSGTLTRIEVKSCAVRRARPPAAAGPAAAGLNFYMSEAERKMAALYLKAVAFKGESWRLQMYAPREGHVADGSSTVAVEEMQSMDLTSVVSKEIVGAKPQGGSGGGLLRTTEWAFAL